MWRLSVLHVPCAQRRLLASPGTFLRGCRCLCAKCFSWTTSRSVGLRSSWSWTCTKTSHFGTACEGDYQGGQESLWVLRYNGDIAFASNQFQDFCISWSLWHQQSSAHSTLQPPRGVGCQDHKALSGRLHWSREQTGNRWTQASMLWYRNTSVCCQILFWRWPCPMANMPASGEEFSES